MTATLALLFSPAALLLLTPAAAPANAPIATAASSSPAAPTASNPLSGGLNPLSPTPTTTSTTATAVSTSGTATAGGSGLSTASALVIVIGAVGLIGGISYFIWRDARRRAPVRGDDPFAGGEGRRPGSKAPPKPRKLSPAERRRRKRGRARR